MPQHVGCQTRREKIASVDDFRVTGLDGLTKYFSFESDLASNAAKCKKLTDSTDFYAVTIGPGNHADRH